MTTFTLAILLFTFVSAPALLYATRHTKLEVFTRLTPALLPAMVVWLAQATLDGNYMAASGALLWLLACLYLSGICLRALRWRSPTQLVGFEQVAGRITRQPERFTCDIDCAAASLVDVLRRGAPASEADFPRRLVINAAVRDALKVHAPLPPRLLHAARNYAIAFVDHKLYGEVDDRTERMLQLAIDDLHHAARESTAERSVKRAPEPRPGTVSY